jgi:hypothetical protein
METQSKNLNVNAMQDQLKDKVRDISSEFSSQSSQIMNDASERVSELYEASKGFIEENQTAVYIGLGVTVGLLGFFLGRATKSID